MAHGHTKAIWCHTILPKSGPLSLLKNTGCYPSLGLPGRRQLLLHTIEQTNTPGLACSDIG